MKRKIIFFLFLFILIGLIGVYLYISYVGFSPDAIPPIKNLTYQIEKNIQKKIYFAKFKTNLFNRITLTNFSLSYQPNFYEPAILKIKTVTINFNILNLLTYLRKPEKAFDSITFEQGKIYLTNSYLSANETGLFPTHIFSFPKMYFKDVVLEIEDVNKKFPSLILFNLSGYFIFKERNYMFNLTGKNSYSTKDEWNLKGSLTLSKEENTFSLWTEGKNFDLSLWGKYLRHQKIKLLNGKSDFVFELTGKNGKNLVLVSYLGKFYPKEMGVRIEPLPTVITVLSGEIEFNREKLSLHCLQTKIGNSLLKIEGEAKDIFGQVSFHGKIESENLNFKALKLKNFYADVEYTQEKLTIAPLTSNLGDGKVDGEIYFVIPKDLRKLYGEGKLEIENVTLHKKLPKLNKFKAKLHYLNSKLEIYGDTPERTYKLNLIAYTRPQEIRVEQFIFSVVPATKDTISGELRFRGIFSGSINNPIIKGKIWSNKLAFGDERYTFKSEITSIKDGVELQIAESSCLKLLFVLLDRPKDEIVGKFSGYLNLSGMSSEPRYTAEIRIEQGHWKKLSWKTLETKVVYTKQILIIENFLLKQQENLKGQAGELSLQFRNDKTGDKTFPFMLLGKMKNFYWQNLSLTGDFQLNGSILPGQLEATLSSSEIFQVNEQNVGQVKGEVLYADNVLTLSSWSIGKLCRGEGKLNFSPRIESIEGQISIDKTKWSTLEKIFKCNTGLEGVLNTTLVFAGKFSNPKLKGNFQFQEAYFSYGTTKEILKFSAEGDYSYNFSSPLVLKSMISFQGPFSGQVQSKFVIDDLFGEPKVKGYSSSDKILFKTVCFEKTKLEFESKKGKIEFNGFETKIRNGELYIRQGSYLEQDKFFVLAELRNLDLLGFSLLGRVNLEGRLRPKIETKIVTDNFWVNQHNFSNTKIYLRYDNKIVSFLPVENERAQFTGQVDFSKYPEKVNFKDLILQENNEKILSITGIIATKNSKFVVQGNKFPLQSLVELNNWNFTADGRTNFYINGYGSLDSPHLRGKFDLSEGKIYNLFFDSFTVLFALEENIFSFKDLQFCRKDKFLLTGSGHLPVSDEKVRKSRVKSKKMLALNLKLSDGDLSLLDDLFKKSIHAKGKCYGEINIRGEPTNPYLQGKFLLSNGEIETNDICKKITNLNTEIEFSEHSIYIRSGQAKIGQGIIQLGGRIILALTEESKPINLKISEYDLFLKTITDKGIDVYLKDLVIPQSTFFKRLVRLPSQGEAKVNLSLSGSAKLPTLRGTIELVNTHFTYPPQEESKGNWKELFYLVNWDTEIKTGNNVWYENELVNVNVQGYLKLTGEGKEYVVNGRIESLRGTLTYLNRNFEIKKAVFEVINDVCYLEGTGETETSVQDPVSKQPVPDTITMVIERGRLGETQPKFYSKNFPDLTQEKALKNVFANVDTSAVTVEEQQKILRREILRWFDAGLATPLIQNIVRYSGLVDTVRVTREAGQQRSPGTEETTTMVPGWRDFLSGSKYTFEKYVSKYLLLGYSIRLDTLVNRLDLRHEIELAYRLRWKGDVFLRAIYELERSASPTNLTPERKIYIEPRWRFGWEE